MSPAKLAADSPSARFQPLEGGLAATPWLWLGTWSLGGEGFGAHDLAESRRLLEEAVEAGIRHFDTAGFYAHGKSEELVGKVVRERRRELFLSTKGGLVWEGRSVRHRARPADLQESLDDSLRRLQTDYVDLYQLHWPDPEVPIAESVGALEELCAAGKARFWGVGNLQPEDVRTHLRPGALVPHQVAFNPVHRNDRVLAAGAEERRALNCVVSPFEQGLLAAGRGSRGLEALGKRDARRRNPRFSDPEVLSWVVELGRLSEATTRASTVLLWILSQPGVHVVVPGPRVPSQLRALMGLAARIDALGLPPPLGEHHAEWQRALEAELGHELWAHLGAFRA